MHLKKARAAKLPLVLDDSVGSSEPPASRVAIVTWMRETREFQNKMQAALQGSEHKMETLTSAQATLRY